jgi:DNA-binding transcriptional MerR regulator
MAATLNIAALARRTGIAPDTLRKWEQRYGILRPERTKGGQRRYSELDVARVEWLRDRLGEGYRISEAARILGGGTGGPAATPEELPDELLAALRENDADRLVSLLDQTFGTLPLRRALGDVVAPLLERIGAAWESGEISPAQEHLLTAKLRSRLEQLLADDRGGNVRGTAVLACAPGERHDLGLLMLAVLLRGDGWRVEYLGADTPAKDAFALAGAVGADLVCITVAVEESATRLRAEVGGRAPPGGPPVAVGGRAATAKLARALGARLFSGELEASVRELRAFGR